MRVEQVLRLLALGLSVIPLRERSKLPALPEWKIFQHTPPTEACVRDWVEKGLFVNTGIVLGQVSRLVVVESDSPEAERWCSDHLPDTPMKTRSARGVHRYYRLPGGEQDNIPIPALLKVDGLSIEVKREGQYVVAPGSVHPSGHIYAEVQPWPSSLEAVPEFPLASFGASTSTPVRSEPIALPAHLLEGQRNEALFREGCRLRRLGWEEAEIAASLLVLNSARCRPPLKGDEVERVATSCATYGVEPDERPLTEAGDAEFFAAFVRDMVRYDHRRGRWLLFTGHRWTAQKSGEVYRLALDGIRQRLRSALDIRDDAKRQSHLKWALRGEDRRRLTNLIALAQNVHPIADIGDGWDRDPWLLGVENGVVDLRTGHLRAGTPADRITMAARSAFIPEATCPLWDKTLREIFNGDDDLLSYFDRFVGYSLTGDCREEVLLLCWGTGANGKGVTTNTLAWLLGDYADDLPFSTLELHERSSIPNDIAKIVGKRFVTSSESAETKRLNEARVKALTGRDPITARFLHREFFTFQPVAKFWLATNHKPVVRDTSVGFWRRIHLLPFTRSFAEEPDLQLKDKLRREAAGILARAVRGALAWQARGLDPPAVVREATSEYRVASMPLTRFLDARCVVADGPRCTFGELFDAYTRWCGDVREPRLTRSEFGEALREQFKTDPNAKRHVTFLGVGLIGVFVEE